jgi:hypothetical protein
MTEFATSAGHWYTLDGEPCYTIVGKNGAERNTTLRDARTMALVPSVTTIIRQAAAPALEKWKRDQLLMAALTLPRTPNEPEAEWLKRVERDSQEQGRKAADRGTAIHGSLERHYRGEMPDEEHWEWVKVCRTHLENVCGHNLIWKPERSFAHPLGYGGKVDLHCAEWIIDFKTKDGVEGSKLWDDHYMQLAAYRRALCPNARAGILFVDRTQPICLFVEAEADKMASGLVMFDSLLAFWQAKTGYYPMRAAA